MENAADALKMAFAIFVFMVALSTAFFSISKAKEMSDQILWYSDETNYYRWETGSLENGRVVGEDTVISTLYKHDKELIYVIIKDKDGNIAGEFSPENKDVRDFINLYLKDGTKKFLENLSDVSIDGQYAIAEDGTRLLIKKGGVRTYVTYTQID